MPSCGFIYGDGDEHLADVRQSRRRPVNQGARRGVTQSPKRKRRRK